MPLRRFMTSVYHEVMKRITVDLDEGLFERLRRAAFDRREPMSEIVREALEKVLPQDGEQ
jgi:metal-responsive CopG/Arc/MetJ family transcriptional regulator